MTIEDGKDFQFWMATASVWGPRQLEDQSQTSTERKYCGRFRNSFS
jgi:hypothetical protein